MVCAVCDVYMVCVVYVCAVVCCVYVCTYTGEGAGENAREHQMYV